MKTTNYFLRVNGIAATANRTKRECIQMAERGHQLRPDAVVELVKFDTRTNTDVETTRLYN